METIWKGLYRVRRVSTVWRLEKAARKGDRRSSTAVTEAALGGGTCVHTFVLGKLPSVTLDKSISLLFGIHDLEFRIDTLIFI